ncbi:MAG: DNA polymerase III subunit alpha [Bacteroidales bacterium]|nr:DNA polymerase III subunit alpha [Bacteroidales bacterium]
MNPFTHLHVHTQYSILDGASSVPLLLKKAKENNMTAVAITDHGNLFGAKHFYDTARANGIKPIIGCEVYVSRNSRLAKAEKSDRGGNHLILLAKNKLGYQNLSKLVSMAWIEGHYYKPRIDKALLEKYSEGIIASSACLGGEVPQAFLNNDEAAAEESVLWFKQLFGEDYYLELQRHKTGDPEIDSDTFTKQEKVNNKLIQIAKKHNIKIIATNDVHFINEEDAEAHDRLICLNTGKDLDDPNRLRYTQQEWFKSQEEMNELFSDIPVALENTMEVAAKVSDYELDRTPIMPDFPIPDNFKDADEYLRHISFEGAKERYETITDEIKERIEFELSVIKNMGYPGYFLIVHEVLKAAREMGVSVGPGRGSAAGSVVAYSLRIIDIDPLKYGLLFERFLNPDRISLPDIDIDFDEDGRDDVLKWVVNRYGKERVAHIITFGTMAAKMAIRDIARVQKLPLPEADRLAKLVPERPKVTLADAYKEVKELREAKDSDNPLISQTLKYAQILEGSKRHTGVHACGIIIGKSDLIDHIPLCTSKDSDLMVTQFDGDYVESVGMLKMDFLGLKTLSKIRDAVENIKESKGIDLDIESIPLDDPKTFELFSNGETTALFQFESDGMKKHLKELKPNRFEDLIAMNALYRPGPMDYIPKFISRKHGKSKIQYDLPVMEEYLKDTYGITVYQEQVMQLSMAMADFTRGEADSLRKAMGKKKKKEMDKLKEKFLEGSAKNNIDKKIAEQVWHDWEAFAQYAFNKSHSTSYAYVAYRTAYLKAHYPSEYMAAVLSREIKDIKKITQYMDESKRMGISVLGPDVNESNIKFTVNKEGNIRFGLGAIKGVGKNAAAEIVKERKQNGPFTDIFDFVERVDLYSVNKKNLEALAISGSFDNFENIKREQYFAETNSGSTFTEDLIRYGNRVSQEKNTTQQSLFGEAENFEFAKPAAPIVQEWSKVDKLKKEKELVGVYISAHPLDDFKFEINSFSNVTLNELDDLKSQLGKDLSICGIVSEFKTGMSKNGKPYGFLTIQDYRESFRIALFNSDFLKYQQYFKEGLSLLIKGKVEASYYREGEHEFKVKSVHLLTEARDEFVKSVQLSLPVSIITPEFVNELEKVSSTKGNILFKFNIFDPGEKLSINLFSRTKRIKISDRFLDFIDHQPGVEISVK